ncbi:HAD family hydrolase [Microbacterium suaedae]|uniref:HAD family hydrolase n=1 Tax=Microbacterium suaedae TaxID=2067813 RepID=UPI000DA1F32E|nr:HAD family hydrolase [Microbacterium suaedae]
MLVATDLDGTLVPPDSGVIPDYTARVLRDLDASGIPVVFVTGRPLRWIESLRRHIGRHGLAIVSNGAVTYDLRAGRAQSVLGIPAEDGFPICRDIARAVPRAQFAIECVEGIRLANDFDETFPMAGAPRGPLEEIWTDPAVKLLVQDPTTDPVQLHERVAEIVGERATATWSVPGLVEISSRGVTKATALASLCASRGIDAADVIAFGDMPNDIPMLTWAGTAYAVADAHESVRAVANHTAAACAEEGVARVLEGLVATATEAV